MAYIFFAKILLRSLFSTKLVSPYAALFVSRAKDHRCISVSTNNIHYSSLTCTFSIECCSTHIYADDSQIRQKKESCLVVLDRLTRCLRPTQFFFHFFFLSFIFSFFFHFIFIYFSFKKKNASFVMVFWTFGQC